MCIYCLHRYHTETRAKVSAYIVNPKHSLLTQRINGTICDYSYLCGRCLLHHSIGAGSFMFNVHCRNFMDKSSAFLLLSISFLLFEAFTL